MCAVAAAANIAVLMAANLAGFVVGLDGLRGALRVRFEQAARGAQCSAIHEQAAQPMPAGLLLEVLASPAFAAATLATFAAAANLMFAQRS